MTRQQIIDKIAYLEAKLSACRVPESRYYYAMCLRGWREMLIKHRE